MSCNPMFSNSCRTLLGLGLVNLTLSSSRSLLSSSRSMLINGFSFFENLVDYFLSYASVQDLYGFGLSCKCAVCDWAAHVLNVEQHKYVHHTGS
jgi:hypothetical protein